MNLYQRYLTIQQGVVLQRSPADGGIIIRTGVGVGLAAILQLLLLLVVVLPQMALWRFIELSDS